MATLPWLDPEELFFPEIEAALQEPNGLLAVGGDLSPQRLLLAYQRGVFPWFEEGEPILWWSPTPRAVLFPENIVISKSLNKRLRQQQYRTSCDQAFDQVIAHCANTVRRGQAGTWITEKMQQAYITLHHQGYAHSIEAWCDDELVGGLYGISIGQLFFGESMFSLKTDASKVAFVGLAQNLQAWGYPLIDCQVSNPHLTSLGAEPIDRQTFKDYLATYTVNKGTENWAASWQQPTAVKR